MSHELLVLANIEKDKGYWRSTCFSEMGRKNIRAGILKRFDIDLPWKKIKSRFEYLRGQYDIYKRVTKDATGLGFNQNGELDMSNDWWDELAKIYPEAIKLRRNPLSDIPHLDQLYSKVTISVSEGWQHQDGPSSLPQVVQPEQDEDFVEMSSQIYGSETSQKAQQPHSSSIPRERPNKLKPVRKIAKPSTDHWTRLTTTLENQEKFWTMGRKAFDSFKPFSCALCNEELLKMSTLDHDGELYWAALEFLAKDENSREIFMTQPNEERKIKYLERLTGKKQ